MSASQDGTVPPGNVINGAIFKSGYNFRYAELCDDLVEDTIKEIESLVGSSEVGLPRAYTEHTIGTRVHVFAYKSFPYVVLANGGPKDPDYFREAFRLLVADVRREVDFWLSIKLKKEQLVLVWRLENKISHTHDWCRRCGGSSLIRSRLLVRPDWDMIYPEQLADVPTRL